MSRAQAETAYDAALSSLANGDLRKADEKLRAGAEVAGSFVELYWDRTGFGSRKPTEEEIAVRRKILDAYDLFERAAKKGNAPAQYELGKYFSKGMGRAKCYPETGVPLYRSTAIKWFKKSALQGYAPAEYALAEEYAKSRNGKLRAEAMEWYRQAAVQGHARAQFNLGCCYEQGHGVAKNREEAIKWYQKAAEQGNEDAIDALKRLGV